MRSGSPRHGPENGAKRDRGLRLEGRVPIAEGHVLRSGRSFGPDCLPGGTPRRTRRSSLARRPPHCRRWRPPTVPGIPARNSNPSRPPSRAYWRSLDKGVPERASTSPGPGPGANALGPVSDDEAPVSFVREKDIASAADDIMRDTRLAGEPDRGRKLLGRRRLEEEIGRAADPEAGQLLQGDVPARAASRRPRETRRRVRRSCPCAYSRP